MSVLVVALLGAGGLAIGRDVGARPTAVQSREDDRAARGASEPATPSGATGSAEAAVSPSDAPSPSTSPGMVGSVRTTTVEPAPGAATTGATSTATRPAGQRKIQAFITGYSYFDNTPPGSIAISHPVFHQSAGGTGTYADPITVAVGHSISAGRDTLDWVKGTRFYIPNLRRYFVVEDTCGDGSSPQDGPCHTGYPAPATTWLDIWIGGQGGSASGADSCMNAITGTWDVLLDPGSNYAAVVGSVYGAAGCTQQYGNAVLGG